MAIFLLRRTSKGSQQDGGWFAPTSHFPLKINKYPLKIDGWKMIHVLLKWSLFMGHVVSNIFYFHPGRWGNDQFDLRIFFKWVGLETTK